MKVVVIIPIYKTNLSGTEEISLLQCIKLLGSYDIVMACPKGFDKSHFSHLNIGFEEFDPKYFKDIAGYNELLLKSEFYQRFLKYQYMLIYQLDAFVFRDELDYWCDMGYDYIGSPWLATRTLSSKILQIFSSKKLKQRKSIWYKVGNGGLSLRKIKKFHEISSELAEVINNKLSGKKDIYAIEDVFWSLKVPEYFPDFSIPDYTLAAKFALDRKPKIGLKLNNSKLPFACHGFNKPKVEKFWKPIIEEAFQKTK